MAVTSTLAYNATTTVTAVKKIHSKGPRFPRDERYSSLLFRIISDEEKFNKIDTRTEK
jgi:hypothetical protein